MDLGSIFLILALLILVGLFIGRPLFEEKKVVVEERESEDHNRSMLMAERDRILNALQELDFDHALGKIPEEDYPQQRSVLLQRGANVLRELDALTAENDEVTAEDRLEAAIAARRADMAKKDSQQTVSLSPASNGHAVAPARKVSVAIAQDDDLEVLLAQRKRLRTDKAAGFCPQCGSSIQKSDHFCPKCGAKIA